MRIVITKEGPCLLIGSRVQRPLVVSVHVGIIVPVLPIVIRRGRGILIRLSTVGYMMVLRMSRMILIVRVLVSVSTVFSIVRIRPEYGSSTSLPHCLEHLLLVHPPRNSHLLRYHVYVHVINTCNKLELIRILNLFLATS